MKPAAAGHGAVCVVVPAHDEEAVIRRCLDQLWTAEVEADLDLHVVVVSNGSTDRTAEKARAAGGPGRRLEVVEIGEASKIAALRVGLDRAGRGPVVLLDADVELSSGVLAAMTERLLRSPHAIAAPRLVVDTTTSSQIVRSYYRVWTTLPYVTEGFVGSGVVGVGAQARTRLKGIPDVINDDGWIRRAFPRLERLIVEGHFVVHAPRTAAALLARRARIIVGNWELDEDEGRADAGRNKFHALFTGLRSKAYSPYDAVVFLALTMASRINARVRRLRGDRSWSTDQTSRVDA